MHNIWIPEIVCNGDNFCAEPGAVYRVLSNVNFELIICNIIHSGVKDSVDVTVFNSAIVNCDNLADA